MAIFSKLVDLLVVKGGEVAKIKVVNTPKKIYGRPAVSRSIEEIKECVVDGLFRKRQIHIFGGGSSMGKSRFAIPMLDRISRGEQVFGHDSHPIEFVYVTKDRDYDTAKVLIHELGFNYTEWNIFSCIEDAIFQGMKIKNILERYILPQFPKSKLIFIEGLSDCVEEVSDYHEVSELLHGLLDLCHRKDITIIGTAHAPKMKKGEEYQFTREKLLGTVAWGAFSDTVVGFDFGNKSKGDEDVTRRVVVWPHSIGGQEVFHLTFHERDDPRNDGSLHEVADPKAVRAASNQKANGVFKKFMAEHPGMFIAADMIDYAEKNQVSRTDVFGILKAMVEEGRIEKLRRGEYRVRQLDALDVTPLD